jgi:VIT1/CCC1 family predicted Fe2+/Mn2+ transporter
MHKNNAGSRAGMIWNLTFGVEDSLVSTVGLLSGVAVGGMDKSQVLLTGVVLIFVEAFSMGVGSMIAGQAKREVELKREVKMLENLPGGFVMMISYLLAGLIPLMPYVLFDSNSFEGSILFSSISLLLLGFLIGKLSGTDWRKGALRTFLLGGVAILVGVAVGKIFAV